MRNIVFYTSLISTLVLIVGDFVAGKLQEVSILLTTVIAILLGLIIYLPQHYFHVRIRYSITISVVGAILGFGYLYWQWGEIVSPYTETIEQVIFFGPLSVITAATVFLYFGRK